MCGYLKLIISSYTVTFHLLYYFLHCIDIMPCCNFEFKNIYASYSVGFKLLNIMTIRHTKHFSIIILAEMIWHYTHSAFLFMCDLDKNCLLARKGFILFFVVFWSCGALVSFFRFWNPAFFALCAQNNG